MTARNRRLQGLCDIHSGGTPRRGVREFYGGSIPWAKISDLETPDGTVWQTEETITTGGLEAIRNRLFPAGTLLLAMYGSVGKTAVAGVELATNQAILGIEIKNRDELDAGYLKWWLISIQPRLVAEARGVAQQNISATIVRGLEIPLPTPAEQRRIAAILDKADAIRRKRKQAIELTEQLLRSTFLQMFGDPVTNPNTWQEVRLDQIGEIASGVTKGRPLERKELVEVPYLRVANVQDGYLDLAEIKTISVLPTDVDKYSLRSGDVLLTEGGDPDKLGRGAVWYGQVEQCIHQNHVFRVRPDISEVLPEFLSMLIGSERGKRYFLKAAKQTTGIASINSTQLKAFPVLCPPMKLQRSFLRSAGAVVRLKSNLELAASGSEDLFGSLSQRAFRGEL